VPVLEVVVVLGVAVLVGHLVSRRYCIAPPVVLLGSGFVLGFIPALRRVYLPPEVVLFLFLPVLLYWESLTTSLREIRRNLRGIVMVSTVLVFVTAAAVAAAAHALGMPWGPAWVLGAAVAPTDATAVGVLARALPRRSVTTLRAESLINDGTALVIYGLAVGITVGEEHLSAPHVGGLLLLSYGGGILAGLATAWLGIQVRRRLADPVLENVAILLFPFTAYLLAGLAGVVVCGLIMSWAGPRIGHADQRRQTEAFWSLAMFLLNSALFILVGLELQAAARKLTGADLVGALLLIAVISAMLVIVRLAFLYVAVYLIRLIDRRPQQRLRRVSNRSRVVSGLAGFRGAVSLAVALSVPAALHSGRPFPDRNLIIFVTSGVIVMTLLQALVLPKVVRWARLPPDTSVDEERQLAETTAVEEAFAALPRAAADLGTPTPIIDRLRAEYETHLLVLHAGRGDTSTLRLEDDYDALRLALLARKRATVVRLRDERRIDDIVLRQLQARLDIDEVRLTHREFIE